MAQDWETTIREAAQKTAAALNDAAELNVKTTFKSPAAPGGAQAPVIELNTVIKLDGDSDNEVPVEISPTGIQVAASLFDIHLRNVEAAREYRASMLQALLTALQSQIK
jgi:hypothetical protein